MCRCPYPELCELLGKAVPGGHFSTGGFLEVWTGFAPASRPVDPARAALFRDMWLTKVGLTMADVPAHLRHGAMSGATTATHPDKPLPGRLTMAKNLAVATAKQVAAGLPQADEATVSRRRELCMACPERRSDDRCAKCGCHLATKIAWETGRCPLKKW